MNKYKVITIILILVLLVANILALNCRIAFPNNEINNNINTIIPQGTTPILIISEYFFTSNPWIEIICIDGWKIDCIKTRMGGASNPKANIVAEMIENNIFNNIWILNIVIIMIIILILILKKKLSHI